VPSVKRQADEVIAREHHLSIQRACRIVGLSRTAFYRVPRSNAAPDAAVINVLNGMVAKRPRWGFWKCFDRMRIEGHPWNHKRVHRVYCAVPVSVKRRSVPVSTLPVKPAGAQASASATGAPGATESSVRFCSTGTSSVW